VPLGVRMVRLVGSRAFNLADVGTQQQRMAVAGKKLAVSKSGFVRSQPATSSVAEVIARGRAVGIRLTRQLVSAVRMSQKWTGKRPRARRTRRANKPPIGRVEFARRVSALTLAELEVARFASAGLSNTAVARTRGTSVNTVARQMVVILKKLGIGSRRVLAARVWQDLAAGHGGTLGPTKGRAPVPSRVAAGWATLTVRERQVMRLVARDLTYRMIAKKLRISPTTVSVAFQAACGRLGSSSSSGSGRRRSARMKARH
jgi:DNA-binding NarL/FixJ family response regulator